VADNAQRAKNRTTPLKRMTIFCKNIERSLALYRDILGFTVAEEKSVSGPAMGQMIGVGACTLRIVHLQSERSENGLIGLYEVSGAAIPDAPPRIEGRVHYGQTAMVLYTNHLDDIYAAVTQAGYIFLTKPTPYVKTTDHPMMRAGTYTEMLFYDPDGVLVSITGLPQD
jgi:catechol 2,3-dioxygenase-like lactoylglutathione lyase family enzyme